jgi:hypothetical protein
MNSTPFSGWENFYVIVGSAAGALIGLQFVVMALLADLPRAPAQPQAGSAFATPNVVHFAVVLLLSALDCAPWRNVYVPGSIFGAVGLCGIGYALIVTRRMRKQTAYQPEFEDWLFHSILPFTAYAVLAASAYSIHVHTYWPMFGVGAAALLLLFVGIHNAWDTATYHIFTIRSKKEESDSRHDQEVADPAPPNVGKT